MLASATTDTMPIQGDITAILHDWRYGKAEGLERLVPLIYDELRKVARGHLRREPAGHSLQATALVHEVYLRLVALDRMTIENRAHFLALAARLMRQILVDRARRKRSAKRGGHVTVIGLEDAGKAVDPIGVDVLALDEALDEMAAFDPRQRDLVELKFFGGLTIDEIAVSLGISAATVEREWAVAKAWLFQRLSAPVSPL
jgi:RNA polymerase sigma factor (TIGR02999 family)